MVRVYLTSIQKVLGLNPSWILDFFLGKNIIIWFIMSHHPHMNSKQIFHPLSYSPPCQLLHQPGTLYCVAETLTKAIRNEHTDEDPLDDIIDWWKLLQMSDCRHNPRLKRLYFLQQEDRPAMKEVRHFTLESGMEISMSTWLLIRNET